MIDEQLSDTEATYFAGKVNLLITKLGGLLKFYSDPDSHNLILKKPLKLARVSKIAEYPVKVYTRGYNGKLNITPYNIVKQLPRAAFTRDNVTAIAVKVKPPLFDPQLKDFYEGTAITYYAKNRPAKLMLRKPDLLLNNTEKDKHPANNAANNSANNSATTKTNSADEFYVL